jgi:hypothetical protein
MSETGGRFGERHATHFLGSAAVSCPPGWPRARSGRAVAISTSDGDKDQHQGTGADHQASRTTPGHPLRMPASGGPRLSDRQRRTTLREIGIPEGAGPCQVVAEGLWG